MQTAPALKAFGLDKLRLVSYNNVKFEQGKTVLRVGCYTNADMLGNGSLSVIGGGLDTCTANCRVLFSGRLYMQ